MIDTAVAEDLNVAPGSVVVVRDEEWLVTGVEQDYSPDAGDDAMLRERSLLYVAATRARDELAISWSGTASESLSKETK